MSNTQEAGESNDGCLMEIKNDVLKFFLIVLIAGGVTFACSAIMGNTVVGRIIFDGDEKNTSQNFNNSGSSDSGGILGIFKPDPRIHCVGLQKSTGKYDCIED